MHFRLTGDTALESGLGPLIDKVSGPMRQRFLPNTYGEGLEGLVAVLMCQDKKLNLKPRIRFSTKEKKLYVDVVLDLVEMQKLDRDQKWQAVFERLTTDIERELGKRSIKNFDAVRFLSDLRDCERLAGNAGNA